MKILVTGAAGFVGSNTVEILERHRNKVLALDNLSTGKSENLKMMHGAFCLADITDKQMVDQAFGDFQPEAVLHLAAQSAISTSYADPAKDLTINAIGTLNILQAAIRHKVKRFVFASTSAVYREDRPWWVKSETYPTEPSNPYGISKLACEGYVRTMFPNHIILRYANVYGQRQTAIGENQVIARAFAHFVHGDDFRVVGHGNQKRDFVYVGDIAWANFDALISEKIGTFNAAAGKSYSVNQVLAEIERVYGVPGYKWDHTGENDPRGDVHLKAVKIQKELSWKARCSLAEGIRRTYQWWENGRKTVYGVMGDR